MQELRPSSRRGFLRAVAWNLLLLAAGFAAIAGIGEAWLRLAHPFSEDREQWEFHPKAGMLLRPGAEIRKTDKHEFWTVSRANSLGFADREPIDPQRAAESCHVAVIGDSFVAAFEVPVEEKFHVVLENLAAAALPDLDVTAQAWGRPASGQIEQLPYYDEFARRLRPKLVLLVFAPNDFADNTPLLATAHPYRGREGWRGRKLDDERPPVTDGDAAARAYRGGWRDPDRLPWATAGRSADGGLVLRPPVPPPAPVLAPVPRRPRAERTAVALARKSVFAGWLLRTIAPASRSSWTRDGAALDRNPGLAQWLRNVNSLKPRFRWRPAPDAWTAQLARRPAYARILAEEGDNLRTLTPWFMRFMRDAPSPGLREYALAFTAFALDEFKRRADRDGAALAILSIEAMKTRGGPAFDAMRALAAARGIPVIDQFAYMVREGMESRDLHWRRDYHWNAAGHRLAAGAVLEWLARNRHVCDRAAAAPPPANP